MTGSDRLLVLVAAIGNPDRGDDGFGPAVARRLRGRIPCGVRLLEHSGDIVALIEDWDGFPSVIVVDATTPVAEPGRIHRVDLARSPPPAGSAPRSTHAFGVAETVELARSLGRLPRSVVAYLVEGEQFETGTSLSPAVAKAVVETTQQVIDELSAMLGTSRAQGIVRRA